MRVIRYRVTKKRNPYSEPNNLSYFTFDNEILFTCEVKIVKFSEISTTSWRCVGHYIEKYGQFHAPYALLWWICSSIPIREEAGQTAESIWAIWWVKNFLIMLEIKSRFFGSSAQLQTQLSWSRNVSVMLNKVFKLLTTFLEVHIFK